MNPHPIQNLQTELARKRKEILTLPPEQALERILSDPQPAALVHSFEAQDFYFLLHDIGVEDALELLGLAATRQWEYILDAEIWDRDHLDVAAATRWLFLMMKAAPGQLVWWAMEEQSALMEYVLFKTVQVVIREHDQDASEIKDGFVSFDDVFYFRPIDAGAAEATQAEALKQMREAFTVEFLKRIAAYDHIAYQNILLESASVLPAEMEEELFRLRNVRRAEKGFMPFHEAIGIYQPLAADTRMRKKRMALRREDIAQPIPVTPASMIASGERFSEALAVIDSETILMAIQEEFAGLCNQVVSADRLQIRDRTALAETVRKVCGYLHIGMETEIGKHAGNTRRYANMIQSYPLESIFRIGYGQVLELKWEAEKWRQESWAEAMGLPLGFWGETWVGVLGGLLIRRPLYFDNYAEGTLYRDFRSLVEVVKTRRTFEEIKAMDRLFLEIDISVPTERRSTLSWKNLLLTLWAGHCLTGDTAPNPIPVAMFRPFFKAMWEIRDGRPVVEKAARESFLDWLAARVHRSETDLSALYARTLETLFAEIEAEYRDIPDSDLDPRFVRLFLLS